jgi:hypothetical protein
LIEGAIIEELVESKITPLPEMRALAPMEREGAEELVAPVRVMDAEESPETRRRVPSPVMAMFSAEVERGPVLATDEPA